MKYSIIVPVFNRPDEVDELLESLCSQTLKDFEVVIVEDGSQKPCKDVCDKYAGILDLHYYNKENSGPGQSRNYGVERAQGEYVIILDSDVVLPNGYLAAVNSQLSIVNSQFSIAFGGPDASHPSFTPVQKAISYSMTSFFTTGGIRGGKAKLDKFYPRSFNMGSIRSWVVFRRCASARTSTSPIALSRQAISRASSLMHGYGISDALTSASSSDRFTTAVLPVSIWRNAIPAH